MTTQKEIIECLKNGKPVKRFERIQSEFNALYNSKNYNWMFQKTSAYWTDANWKIVARDVQQALKHYYSK